MTAALTPFPKFRAFDADGDPLAGGKLHTFEAGTNTPKATYTTYVGNIANANPVVLNANGEADVWLTGLYKFRLDDASDVVQWTVDNVGTASLAGNPFYILSRDYGNDLAAAVVAIGASKVTLYITEPCAVSTNITVPRNIDLVIHHDGLITVNGGSTLTLTTAPEAGQYQIFTGAGSVTWANGATVWAEWWGAAPGANSATAIQTALNAASSKMHVRVGEGTYLVNTPIVAPLGSDIDWKLEGQGMEKTILQRAAGFAGTILSIGNGATAANRYAVRELGIDGIDKAAGTVGVRVNRAGQSNFEHVAVEQCEKGLWYSGSSYHKIENCVIEDNTNGLIFDNTGAVVLTFATLKDTLFSNNEICFTVDSSVEATGLLRNIGLYRCSFENDTLDSGTDIGLKIRESEQIHLHECWFESNSRHVDIDGSSDNVNRRAQFLTFTGCNFGEQNDDADDDILFLFEGDEAGDGRGCFMESCRFNGTEYHFNQDTLMELRNCALFGNAELVGNSWFMTGAGRVVAQEFRSLESRDTWRVNRWVKDEVSPVVLWSYDQVIATEQTTDDTPTVIATFTVPGMADPDDTRDTTAKIIADVVARTNSNANQAAYQIVGLFRNLSGTVTQRGSTQDGHPAIETDSAWGVIFDINGTSVRVIATGAVAANIRWETTLRIWMIRET